MARTSIADALSPRSPMGDAAGFPDDQLNDLAILAVTELSSTQGVARSHKWRFLVDASTEGQSSDQNEIRAALQEQIDALKEQLSSVTEKLSEGADQAKQKAAGLYDAAADQARDIGQVARAYPVAMSSVTITGLAVGLLLGMVLSHLSSPPQNWYDRRWR